MSLTDCLTNKPFEEQKRSKHNNSWFNLASWSIMNWSYFVVICIFLSRSDQLFPGLLFAGPLIFLPWNSNLSFLRDQIVSLFRQLQYTVCIWKYLKNLISENLLWCTNTKTFLFSSLSPDGIMTWGKIVSLRWHHWWSSNYIASTQCPHIKLGCRLHKSFIRFQDPFILGSLKYLGVNQPK